MTQEPADAAQLENPSSSHRIYLADSIGCLRVAQCAPPTQLPENYPGPTINTVVLPGFKSHSDHAVQRLARGVLSGDAYVVAMARKNATIDVVHLENQQLPSSSHAGSSKNTSSPMPSEQIRARILCTIKEDKMKAGIHRFIGLAVGSDGVYSITSSGIFRFTPIQVQRSASGEISAQQGTPKVIDLLPSPLQHASFYPTTNPTHFCYGGEDIPLSIWSIPAALSEPNRSTSAGEHLADESSDSINGTADDAELNSKQRKRKRQREAKSKASELLWGEVWRAKNLPNDSLSLPRRANITCTAILHLSTQEPTDLESSANEEGASFSADTTIVVGTKDGLLRVFEPGKGSRKHTKEIRVVPANAHQVAIKTLCASSHPLDPTKGGVVFVGDTGSKVYCVDWRSGSLLYGYKSMTSTGSVLSMAVLPSPSSSTRRKSSDASAREPESLVAVSSDSLVKFFSTVPAAEAVPRQGQSPEKGDLLWSELMVQDKSSVSAVNATPTAVVWDGVLPSLKKASSVRSNGAMKDDDEEEEDDDDEEEDAVDEVWAEMEEVDDSMSKGRKSSGRRSKGDADDDDEDDEEDGETTSKTTNPKKRGGSGGKKARK